MFHVMDTRERSQEILKDQQSLEARDHRQRRDAEQAAVRRMDARGESLESRVEEQSARRHSAEEAARLRIERGVECSDSPQRPSEVETLDQVEQRRITGAAEVLRENKRLMPEQWSRLNQYDRKAALDSVGKALRDAYECPDPPVLPKDFPEYSGGRLLGYYADGATKEAPQGDYELALNNALMRSDNPRDSLETYLHEFRHAYQHEMASRFDKPQFAGNVHDIEQAAEWSRNFRNYKNGPPEKMPADHPDFSKLFKEYENQPVEKDAREFSERLLREMYRV